MSQSQPQDIEVYIQEVTEKELTFEEKIVFCEKELQDSLKEHKYGIFDESENVTDAFLLRKIEEKKEEYISLICESSEKEYNWWVSETVDRLLCGCIDNAQNENFAKSQELMEIFKLYREAKKIREENA